ncbi:ABC transporter permease [Candidatus Pelagibacter sp.]|uniref:ABC transporter permease n=1 Tax=Candidatus Pelagibacter sp. TaxID=2024849 RepID=UPI003F858CE1
MNYLREFLKCFNKPDIWVFYSHKRIALKYRDTILGPFWNVINSIFLISVLSLSYFLFLNPDDFKNFIYRLSISIFFWLFISTTLRESTTTLKNKLEILNERKIDIKNFVCENIYTNFIIFIHSSPIVIILFFVSDFKLQFNLILTFVGLFLVIINLLLISYLITILSAMYKDIEKIVENLVYALFFATPIIWSENMVSEKIQNLLIFNPIYHFIVLFRDPLMNNIDGKYYVSFSICLLLVLIVFIINLKLFKYLEKRIVLYL